MRGSEEREFEDKDGRVVTLNYKNENDMPNGNHVLAIPVYNSQLLFTHHQHRGIEFPGGKVEINEQSKEAVIRELYEETVQSQNLSTILHSIV